MDLPYQADDEPEHHQGLDGHNAQALIHDQTWRSTIPSEALIAFPATATAAAVSVRGFLNLSAALPDFGAVAQRGIGYVVVFRNNIYGVGRWSIYAVGFSNDSYGVGRLSIYAVVCAEFAYFNDLRVNLSKSVSFRSFAHFCPEK